MEAYEVSHYGCEKERYMPAGRLDELMTYDAVQEVISSGKMIDRLPPEEQKVLIEFIIGKAKKLLAISISCGVSGDDLLRAMGTFLDMGFEDEHLPVPDPPVHPVFEMEPWGKDQPNTSNFYDRQWKFQVPTFGGEQMVYRLDQKAILPFKCGLTSHKEGTFGKVFQVEIHESHLNRTKFKVKGNLIAVKEIVADNIPEGCNGTNGKSEVWDTEASALTQLSDVVHDNLIQCIAAIDKTDRYYFLFPWADGGSLRDFWDNTPYPVLSAGFVRAIITQFDGMAQALRELHDFRGKRSPYRLREAGDLSDGGGIRHGDLKPENILRFVGENDIGTLKIADMGLAKHHLKNTRLRQKVTSTKYGTTRYEPPEAEHSLNPLSRLYDIWSMGCITLELLIWLLRGNAELVKFDELLDPAKPGRPFYFIKETGGVKEAVIRKEVNAYIGMLEEDPRCAKGTALGDLLDVVKNKLLVISLPDIPDVLANDSRTIIITPSPQAKPGPKHYRVTARALCTSLAAILDHTDDDYFDAARSRPLSVPHIVLSAGSDSETALSRRGSRADLHPDAAYDIASRPKDGLGLDLPRVAAQPPVTATQMRGNVSGAFWIRS